MNAPAVASLVAIIISGDLSEARAWAAENEAALRGLQTGGADRAAVAQACGRWQAPMVWPWAAPAVPTKAEGRVLEAIRAGRAWRASEDTVAAILAFRWASVTDGVWRAA